MDTRKTIGLRINAALARNNMKQKELAKAIGVTDNTISYYCSGARCPQTHQLAQIAQILNTTTDYLLGLTNNPSVQKTAVDELHLPPKAIEKIQEYSFYPYTIVPNLLEMDSVWKLLDFFQEYYYALKADAIYDELTAEKAGSDVDSMAIDIEIRDTLYTLAKAHFDNGDMHDCLITKADLLSPHSVVGNIHVSELTMFQINRAILEIENEIKRGEIRGID